jgi:hypothetical protein
MPPLPVIPASVPHVPVAGKDSLPAHQGGEDDNLPRRIMRFTFLRNGDPYFTGRKVVYNPKSIRSYDQVRLSPSRPSLDLLSLPVRGELHDLFSPGLLSGEDSSMKAQALGEICSLQTQSSRRSPQEIVQGSGHPPIPKQVVA